ncbi:hypothetical protein E2320_009516 [Naja naja]|nr:hypothetical protein E2320_009516 [Naja naja]
MSEAKTPSDMSLQTALWWREARTCRRSFWFQPSLKRKRLACPDWNVFQDLAHEESKEDVPFEFKNQSLPAVCDSLYHFSPDDEKDILEAEEELNTAFMSEAKTPSDMSLQTAPLVAATSEDLPQVILGFSPSLKRKRLACPDWNVFQDLAHEESKEDVPSSSRIKASLPPLLWWPRQARTCRRSFWVSALTEEETLGLPDWNVFQDLAHEESKEDVPFEFKNQSLPAVCDSLYHFSPDDEKDILEAEEELNTAFMSEAKTPSDMSLQTAPLVAATSEDLPQVILGFSPSLKRKRLACPDWNVFQDLAHEESKEDVPFEFKNQSLPAVCDSLYHFSPDDEKDILEAEEELNTAFMSEAKTPSDMSLQTAPLVAATSEDLPQVILGFSPSLKRKRLACPDWNVFQDLAHEESKEDVPFEFKNQSLPAVYRSSGGRDKRGPAAGHSGFQPLTEEETLGLPGLERFPRSRTRGKQRGRSFEFKNQSLPAVCDSLYHFSPDDEKDILEAEEELNTAFMSEAKTPSDMSLQTAPLVAATSEDLPQVILGFSPSLKRKRLACPDWNVFQDLAHEESKEDVPSTEEELNTAFMSEAKTPSDMSLQTAPLVAATSEDLPQVILGFSPSLKRKRLACPDWNVFQDLAHEESKEDVPFEFKNQSLPAVCDSLYHFSPDDEKDILEAEEESFWVSALTEEETLGLPGLERFQDLAHEESKEDVPFEFKNQSLPAVCDSLYHFSPDDEKDILEAEEELNTAFMSEAKTPSDMSLQTAPLVAATSEDLPQVILGFSPSLKRKRLACRIGTFSKISHTRKAKRTFPSTEEELNTAFMSEAKTPSDMSLQTAPLVAATSEDLPQVILGFSPSLKRKRLACPDWNVFQDLAHEESKEDVPFEPLLWCRDKRGPAAGHSGFQPLTEEETLACPDWNVFQDLAHEESKEDVPFEFKNQSLPAVCDSLYHFSPDDEKDILEAEEELNTAFMSEAKTPSDMSLQTAPLVAATSEDLPQVILGFSPSLKRKRLACRIGTFSRSRTRGKQRGRSFEFKNQSLPAVCDSLYHFSPDDEKDILEAEEELNTAFMSEAKTPSDMSLQTAPLVAATSEDLPQVILGFSPSLKRKRLACPDWNVFQDLAHEESKEDVPFEFKNQSLPAVCDSLYHFSPDDEKDILEAEEELNTAFMSEAKTPSDMSLQTAPLVAATSEDLPQVILGFSPSLKRKRLACPDWNVFQDLAHEESKEDVPFEFKNQSLPAVYRSSGGATSEDLPQVILGFSPSLKRKRLACPDWNVFQDLAHEESKEDVPFEFKNQSLPAVCDSLYHFSPDDEKDILEAEEELNTAFMSEAKTPSDMSLQTAPLVAATSEDLPQVILGFSPSLKRKRLACRIGTFSKISHTRKAKRTFPSKFKNQSLPAVCDSLYHFSPDDEKDILEAEEELNTAFMSEAKTPSDMSLQTAPLVAATSEDLPQVILGFSPSLKRKRLACPDWNVFQDLAQRKAKRTFPSIQESKPPAVCDSLYHFSPDDEKDILEAEEELNTAFMSEAKTPSDMSLQTAPLVAATSEDLPQVILGFSPSLKRKRLACPDWNVFQDLAHEESKEDVPFEFKNQSLPAVCDSLYHFSPDDEKDILEAEEELNTAFMSEAKTPSDMSLQTAPLVAATSEDLPQVILGFSPSLKRKRLACPDWNVLWEKD